MAQEAQEAREVGAAHAVRAASARRTVVVTGVTGTVAAQLLPALRERYDLRLVDGRAEDRQGRPVEGVVLHDLRPPDLEAHRALFRGADAVVHLAYFRAPERGYLDQRGNVDMAYHVYQLALEEGLERVVMASSNHAADWYEPLVHAREKDVVLPDERPLAVGFYGWSKAAYEHLGFLYAQGAFGRKLGVAQVRIGAPRDLAQHDTARGPAHFKRALGAWVSPRDLAQLFCRSLDAPAIDDGHGIPFQIFYGISDNTRAFWSIANARRVIGYQPQDDSELHYAALVRELLSHSPGRLGGDRAAGA